MIVELISETGNALETLKFHYTPRVIVRDATGRHSKKQTPEDFLDSVEAAAIQEVDSHDADAAILSNNDLEPQAVYVRE